MTKAEEMKLLEQIESLLAKAEPDGYVAEAFRGCVADARTNIENDWMISNASRYAEAEDKRAAAARELVAVRAELASVKEDAERYMDDLNDARKERDAARADLQQAQAAADLQKEEAAYDVESLKEALQAERAEVVRLKARCFDLMEAAR